MNDIIPLKKIPANVAGAGSIRACPKCRSAKRTRRIPRPLWMRIFPHSMNMLCGQCGHQFWRIR